MNLMRTMAILQTPDRTKTPLRAENRRGVYFLPFPVWAGAGAPVTNPDADCIAAACIDCRYESRW